MTYLRHRRLCEARILLKQSTGQRMTVADIAFKKGFSDFGRFSGYYRSLFGENPSETLKSARLTMSPLQRSRRSEGEMADVARG